MANKLLAERRRDPVGKNWPDAFIMCVAEPKTRWARAYDRQRALNEDSQVIGNWFGLGRSMTCPICQRSKAVRHTPHGQLQPLPLPKRPWSDITMEENYGILDQDTYNFDETGFMMGVISSQLVVTGVDRRGKPKMVQPGIASGRR